MKRLINKNRQYQAEQAFTLVEVMIAGLIMGGMMVGVSQLSIKAMAGNNNQKNRFYIEAAINNDMQLIQQKDSQLTYQWIEENDDPNVACANPGLYLASMIKEENGPFESIANNLDRSGKELFTRKVIGQTINPYGGPKLLTQVKYSFDGPDRAIQKENRIIELSPSFQSHCYQ
jgi:type II secretory pathway pseudopilin PulG